MTQSQQKPGRRTGSAMSDKQVAMAAVQKRLLTFRFLAASGVHEVRGYVVGMDDYKWLVASPFETEVSTALVHKSADLVLFGPAGSLDGAFVTPSAREEITAIGSPFWDYCDRTYNGRTGH